MEKLAPPIQKQFKNKLAVRVKNPHNPANKLRGFQNVYKIKLRSAGYRLVYEVEVNDAEIFIYIIAVGKRERG